MVVAKPKLYCLGCRKKVLLEKAPTYKKLKGRAMMTGNCKTCSRKITQFISQDKFDAEKKKKK